MAAFRTYLHFAFISGLSRLGKFLIVCRGDRPPQTKETHFWERVSEQESKRETETETERSWKDTRKPICFTSGCNTDLFWSFINVWLINQRLIDQKLLRDRAFVSVVWKLITYFSGFLSPRKHLPPPAKKGNADGTEQFLYPLPGRFISSRALHIKHPCVTPQQYVGLVKNRDCLLVILIKFEPSHLLCPSSAFAA